MFQELIVVIVVVVVAVAVVDDVPCQLRRSAVSL